MAWLRCGCVCANREAGVIVNGRDRFATIDAVTPWPDDKIHALDIHSSKFASLREGGDVECFHPDTQVTISYLD